MKHLFTILALAGMAVFSSCSKDNTSGFVSDGKLTGTWELRRISSAMLQPMDLPAGNGATIRFSASEYARFENGQLKKRGTYTVSDDATVEQSVCLVIPAGLFTKRIVYDNNQSATKVFIDLSDGSLRFISGCYAVDAGHSETYVKVSNSAITD
ncbi:hypothetical protein [Sediminibacterium soli]|uniref:hypothetical protein n=1 Tax=Sediminibacterium soli TaxID=2698829 RepID=UPI00137A76EA|nr:hypothetical protein [Sediminibacterium soli]NCI45611.1 hypothetical protein [Sediminibacterium soli]